MASIKRLVFVLVAIVATASSAMAGSVKVGATYGPYQINSGGEFTLINVSGFDPSSYSDKASLSNDSFQTFCVENSTPPEYIYLNQTYNATLNVNAINGGVGPSGDPLSQGTGWLYSQFARGVLADYNYGPGYGGTEADREASANLLQRTFWWLENEGGISYSAANPFMLAVTNQFGSEAAARATGVGGNYGVRVINMKLSNGTLAQDQLFYVPDGGSTAMLLGCALAGLGVLRRRFGAQ